MSDAAALNIVLEREAPALARCLSEHGRELVFPKGIPYQADQARGTEINATIGQLTDGRGGPMALAPIAHLLDGLDPAMSWLYAPIAGPTGLRQRWLQRQRALAGDPDDVKTGLPIATHGLTHAVQLVASLVADPDLDVVVPKPTWGNYKLIVRLAGGGRVLQYDFFDAQGRFNLAGLEATLGQVRSKALVILNFPNNPTGYAPTADEVVAITDLLAAHRGPMVVIVDDAYQGWVFDESREVRSVFWELARKADPDRLQPFKIDGATKELAFFSSRVGFLTTTYLGAASEALNSKLMCQIRGTVGSVSGPALAITEHALMAPDLEEAFEASRQVMKGRYLALKNALERLDSPALRPFPFHGAFFAVARVAEPEALRQKLLTEQSTGIVSFPEDGLIRLAYCSLTEEQVPEMIRRIGTCL